MSADKARKATSVDGELPGGGNVDNIREILFGTHMRQYEKRFQRLEEQLSRESTELREELRRRLDALEAYTKQETTALADAVKAEKTERKSEAGDLAKEVAGLTADVDRRSAALEEAFTKGLRDLRTALLDQNKSLSQEIQDKGDGLLAALRRDIEELRVDKTDRAALASLFTEVALRLGDELRLPTGSDS